MRIIKHGNMKPRIFTCGTCGCEFVAEVNEYRTVSLYGNTLYHEAHCPECDCSTCTSNILEEENE